MCIRILFLLAFLCCFSVNDGFAMREGETVKDKYKQKKNKEKDKENRDPSLSPISKEKEIFSPLRRKIAPKKAIKKPINSPEVRKVGLKAVKNTSHFIPYEFEEKIVYRAPTLINWDDHILIKNKKEGLKWITNLERASRGCAPIAYKGIQDFISIDKIEKTTEKIILKKQLHFTIQLHHLTQRDKKKDEVDGAENNPLIWLTTEGHKSKNARIILEKVEERKFQIVRTGLTKEEANKICEPHQQISTNNLHPWDKEDSKINRREFNKFRKKYWKNEAKMELERRELENKSQKIEYSPLRVRSLNRRSLESLTDEN